MLSQLWSRVSPNAPAVATLLTEALQGDETDDADATATAALVAERPVDRCVLSMSYMVARCMTHIWLC